MLRKNDSKPILISDIGLIGLKHSLIISRIYTCNLNNYRNQDQRLVFGTGTTLQNPETKLWPSLGDYSSRFPECKGPPITKILSSKTH